MQSPLSKEVLQMMQLFIELYRLHSYCHHKKFESLMMMATVVLVVWHSLNKEGNSNNTTVQSNREWQLIALNSQTFRVDRTIESYRSIRQPRQEEVWDR